MSLYTPVFPSIPKVSSSREGLPENSSTVTPGKQRNHVEFLRDIHLFLSTQSDMLSPPSRPCSPMFDRRVEKVRNQIRDVFNATRDGSEVGRWTHVSRTLKLGCARGKHWSVPQSDPHAPEEDTNWILPDEESEWIEWEKKREENRRLRPKTHASQQIGNIDSVGLGSQRSNRASVAKPSRRRDVTRERPLPGISPTVLRAAKEKVRKWQASVTPGAWHGATAGSSSSAAVVASATKGGNGMPQRSRTLDFTVVKPAAKSVVGKKGKGSLSQPVTRGGSTPIHPRKSKTPKPSDALHQPGVTAPVTAEQAGSKQPPIVSPVKDDTFKISDMPETPYLPPSFPSHLKTSTPLPGSAMVIRAKPSPILPVLAPSSTPPPPVHADPPDDRRLDLAEPHAATVSSSQRPQMKQPGKRPRATSMSLEGGLDDPLVTPPAKRLRTLSQQRSTPVSARPRPVSPNGVWGNLPETRDDNANFAPAPSPRYNIDSVEVAAEALLARGKNDEPGVAKDVAARMPSPTKSVKSYFSAPDSDDGDSPVKANLLLESPVSPMLSYAQNASSFLPQITSTQMRKGSPTPSRTNGGAWMGYSSQFDIERQVDRVSELLEKEVDFEVWLQDARTVETSRD